MWQLVVRNNAWHENLYPVWTCVIIGGEVSYNSERIVDYGCGDSPPIRYSMVMYVVMGEL